MKSHETRARRARYTLWAASSVIALMAPGAIAYAQDSNDSGQGKDIVVTAQFREQKLQDTPIAITATTGALMEARSQTSVIDVAAQAPNVNLTSVGGAFGPSITAFIRGVGQNDFNPAYEPGVGLYVDDVYYSSLTGANFDLLDLERVEILRGPQGTLTGRNSIGGAIKLISTRPNGEEGGSLSAAYGERDLLEFRGSANFKLTDTLFGRISVVHKEQEGFVSRKDFGCANPGNTAGFGGANIPAVLSGNCTYPDKFGGEGYDGARAMLHWVPNDRADVLLTADFSHIDRTPSADVLVYSTRPAYFCGSTCNYTDFRGPATNGNLPRVLLDGWGTSLNVDYKLTDSLSLQSISAYRRYDTQFATDDDFSPITPLNGAAGYNDLDHHFVSQEFRLNGNVGDQIEYTLGAYYSDQKTTYFTRQDIGYIVPGVPLQFIGDDPVTADSKAVFGTVFYHPTEKLTITGGLRYTEETKAYTFIRQAIAPGVPVGFGVGALNGLTANYAGDKIDYRLSVDYKFTPDILGYVTVSSGFKGGGVTARPFTATQATNGTFAPEELEAYEIGMKSTWMDGRLRANLAAFFNKYTNQQVPIIDCSAIDGFSGAPCGARVNGGDAEYWGIESEFALEPVENFQIDASLSYIDAEWTRVDPRATTINSGDIATSSPDWNASLGVQYKFDMATSGSITPRLDVNYQGDRFAGRPGYLLGQPLVFDAYTLANARLTWKNANDDLDISLAVTNLADEDYTIQQFNAVSAFAGTAYNTIGQPRTWKVSVKKEF